MLICSLPMMSRQIDNWLLTPSQAMLICSLPMTSKKTDLQITDFNTQSARMVTAWWWRAKKGWLLLHLLLLLHRLALFHKITDARCWEQNGSTHDPVVMTFKHQFLTNSARNGVKHTQNSTHVFFFTPFLSREPVMLLRFRSPLMQKTHQDKSKQPYFM